MSKTNNNKCPKCGKGHHIFQYGPRSTYKIAVCGQRYNENNTPAPKPQPPQGSVEAQEHFGLRVGRYASLLHACEVGSESAAREVEKLILERDALQAQRDELVAALKSAYLVAEINARSTGNPQVRAHADKLQAAIARATEGRGQ